MYHAGHPTLGLVMLDLFGLTGSALIVVSTTMRSVVRLRLIALVGSGVFVVYGLVLPAWPVAITNILTTSVHVYHLHRLYRLRRGAEAGSPRLSKAPSFRRLAVGRRRASA